jgi:hypothetical protein
VLCAISVGFSTPVDKTGVYLISANIKARTIKGWFVETIRKLEARSREISDGVYSAGGKSQLKSGQTKPKYCTETLPQSTDFLIAVNTLQQTVSTS